MTKTARKRTGILGFLGILSLSAGLMLWLVWHFPVSTAIATIIVLSAFAVSARLARSIDSESLADMDGGEQSA